MFARLSFLLTCLVAGVGLALWPSDPVGTEVVFISVGQGDCTLIRSNGYSVLIDVGPRTDTFDGGARLVVPALRRLGVKRIDCLFITHPDMDHVGGLKAVASRLRIGKVVVSDEFRGDRGLLIELDRAGFTKKNVQWIEGRLSAKVGDATLTIAVPKLDDDEKDNEGSLFVRVDALGGSVMTTGDANSETEEEMEDAADWDVQVLKAGHHGSKGSMSSRWLAVTTPGTVVVSCGVRNNYGHPHPDAIARAGSAGARVLRTDKSGSLIFRATNTGFVYNER